MKHQEKKLDEHTWIIEEYDDNVSVYMYLLEGEKEALLIDTGGAYTWPCRSYWWNGCV